MKVYVVTRGSYSDYRIVGVFSSRKAAKDYANARDDHGWDEYEVNALEMPPKGMKSYRVVMDRHGNVPTNPSRYPDQPYIEVQANEPEDAWDVWDEKRGLFFADMWARDKEHAVKIANERRTVALSSPTTTD